MAPPKSRTTRNDRKQANVQAKMAPRDPDSQSSLPLDLQQLLLNIFKDSFSERLESNIKPLLQELKGHLYSRDFLTAFGRQDYLEAYAARWSPSRSLGYLHLLADLRKHVISTFRVPNDDSGGRGQVVCLGGGAGAEVVALGGLLNYMLRTEAAEGNREHCHVVAIDIADWSSIVDKLLQNITAAPTLSKYASAAAHAANAPLVGPQNFNVTFQQHDILATELATLRPLLEGASLVTIMFTLNELYSTSLPLTQKFLLNLTNCLREGALLLVVDSPGSYSTVSLNGAEKKYPMQWLLDHTLLKQGTKGETRFWEKIEEDQSKWFRLDSQLRYPIDLENMRFQLHLYRRTV